MRPWSTASSTASWPSAESPPGEQPERRHEHPDRHQRDDEERDLIAVERAAENERPHEPSERDPDRPGEHQAREAAAGVEAVEERDREPAAEERQRVARVAAQRHAAVVRQQADRDEDDN